MSNFKYWTLLKHISVACLILFTFSCKKDDLNTSTGNVEWMRVLQDTLNFSTDDPLNMARNGKVVTDSEDNIYIYYYSKNPEQTVVGKYDPEGVLIWKKTFGNSQPLDMARLNNGNILLAVSETNEFPNYLTLHSIQSDGNTETVKDTLKDLFYTCLEIANVSISPLQGSSFVISGVWTGVLVGSNVTFTNSEVFVVKHNQLTVKEWIQYLPFICFNCPYTVVWPAGDKDGSSVALTSNGKFLFQFNTNSDGSSGPEGRNILTGLITSDGAADTSFMYNAGKYNRYGNGFMKDGNGDFINYYSSPREGVNLSQAVPAGFLRIGQDAQIKDTIPLSIPNNYRIVSCTQGPAGFLLTAYRGGVANGGSDYSAAHTLFLRGGNDWSVTESFTLQQFYSDYFFSHASAADGSFISMGRIQSFDGPVNKLMLIKWKR
jgi:hypothetical protein